MSASLPWGHRLSGLLTGWRGLARFWGALLAILALGAATLQTLGPAQRRPAAASPAVAPLSHAGQHANIHGPILKRTTEASDNAILPGRKVPGPINDPDPMLLEPFPGAPNLKLPRIAADGRPPMSAYAAGFDPTNMRPRVGILVGGIGMSEADSLAAIKNLPGGISLAISPYTGDLSRLLDLARMTEHEYLLEIPMEPIGYPANDPDDRYALMTSVSPGDNMNRLQAFLARLTGYVGVTNALGEMRGERLSAIGAQFDPVLEEVAQRGLLFVDARIGQALLPYAWNRAADMILDNDEISASILDQRLDALTHMALDKGSALAIVSVPRPLTVDRVAAWTTTLVAKGVALAPVSALVVQPAKQDIEK